MADTPPQGSGKGDRVTSDLAARIASAKRERQAAAGNRSDSGTAQMTGASRALRLGAEFVAAIIVGLGIGYFLDGWLGTRPWIMLVMLLVGFAAGVLNVTRAASQMNRDSPPPPGSDLGPDDEDEDR